MGVLGWVEDMDGPGVGRDVWSTVRGESRTETEDGEDSGRKWGLGRCYEWEYPCAHEQRTGRSG